MVEATIFFLRIHRLYTQEKFLYQVFHAKTGQTQILQKKLFNQTPITMSVAHQPGSNLSRGRKS